MTICLFVCLFTYLLVGLHKYHWLDLYGKNQEIGPGTTQIVQNFESDLDHHLATKKLPLTEVCTPRVLLLYVLLYSYIVMTIDSHA